MLDNSCSVTKSLSTGESTFKAFIELSILSEKSIRAYPIKIR
ncbi:MAG: hypothetical protein AAGB12_07880 [Pseudomonadota bacterium]